jgi:hypothetical protein
MLWLAYQLNNMFDNRFTLCIKYCVTFYFWLESRPFGSNYICRIIHQFGNKNFLLLVV